MFLKCDSRYHFPGQIPVGSFGKAVICLLALFFCLAGASAEERIIDDYAQGLSPAWEEKAAGRRKTAYRVVQKNGRPVLEARSDRSASALIYPLSYDPNQYPLLSWSWKVEKVLEKGNAKHKKTDDYAARVYVVFPGGFFRLPRAVNYVWGNRLPKGTMLPSPYTRQSVMIFVESGPEKAGQWVEETRDVAADYERYFKEKPPIAGAVAVMTDTDQTADTVTAWYGPIRIRARSPAQEGGPPGEARPKGDEQ